MEVRFHKDQLNRIFPFYLLLNRELQVLETGPSLNKLTGDVNGFSFTSLFEFCRPGIDVCNYESLQALTGQLVLFRLYQHGGLMFRGQLELLDNGHLLFMGSPWFASMDEVKNHQLSLDDFAVHDSMIDLLHVVRAQQITTAEVKELYDRLKRQSRELKALAEERAHLALFPMQNPDPVFRIDIGGSLLMKNPATDALFCNKLQIGAELVSLDEFCHLLAQQFAQGQERLVLEAHSVNRFYSFSCIALHQEQYINVYGRDITALKELELHLTRTATRFSHLIANLQAGILMEDERRTIALVNQYFCDLFSIPVAPNELTGADCEQSAQQFKLLFRDPQGFVDRIQYLLESRTIAIGDRLELIDGRVFRRDFIPMWNGTFYMGHLWVYLDITTESKNQEVLEQQRSFYEGILNNIPADLAVFDPGHRYLFLNPSAVKDPVMRQWLIGKDDEEYARFRSKPLSLFKERRQFFEKVKQTKTLQSFEEALQNADGTAVYHLRNFYPVVNDSGDLQMVIGYGLDITERKRIEEALSEARRQTEEEAALKQRFFAAMSHEIRTPLNGILGLSELMEQTLVTEDQRALNSMLRTSGQQLLHIVNAVLDFEKIENGRVELEQLPFDLVDKLRTAAELFRLKAGTNQLLFTSSHPAFFVVGDPYRLDQVINNLLSNAVKFTDNGTVQLQLHIEVQETGKASVTITVEDTGIGIEPEALSSIFLPYMQARNNIAREYGGTGLGLTITRQLIELQGGTITVNSKPGLGSQFIVRLQLPVSETGLLPTAVPAAHEAVELKGLRVLVAEDAEINRFLLRTMLDAKGCISRFVVNGAQACKAVQEEPFDLVLMDVEMPEMDGVQATGFIRKLPGPVSELPVIAVTANAMKGDREMYLRAGMNEYLTKPFTQKKLEEVIGNVLSHKAISGSGNRKPEKSSYDFTYLNTLSDDPAFVVQMIRLFLEVAPVQLEELKKAIQNNDAGLVASVLHQLRPSLEVVGSENLAKECGEIETLMKTGSNPQQQMRTITKLIDSIHKLAEELGVHLNSGCDSR